MYGTGYLNEGKNVLAGGMNFPPLSGMLNP